MLLHSLFIFPVAQEYLNYLSTLCKLLLKQYWFWNTYAYDIAPVSTTIFNRSIKFGIVPDEWKLANLLPIPKESPCTELNQLRPISLTNIIVRLLERAIHLTGDGKSNP